MKCNRRKHECSRRAFVNQHAKHCAQRCSCALLWLTQLHETHLWVLDAVHGLQTACWVMTGTIGDQMFADTQWQQASHISATVPAGK
jgi:hypothetical protein